MRMRSRRMMSQVRTDAMGDSWKPCLIDLFVYSGFYSSDPPTRIPPKILSKFKTSHNKVNIVTSVATQDEEEEGKSIPSPHSNRKLWGRPEWVKHFCQRSLARDNSLQRNVRQYSKVAALKWSKSSSHHMKSPPPLSSSCSQRCCWRQANELNRINSRQDKWIFPCRPVAFWQPANPQRTYGWAHHELESCLCVYVGPCLVIYPPDNRHRRRDMGIIVHFH